MARRIYHVLSLGAGVQSSTLALMLDRREFGREYPKPDFAVFADTGAEPEAVYEWLTYLETQLSFPVHRVKKGDLEKDSLRVKRSGRSGKRYLRTLVPFFTLNDEGDKGILFRKCTADYKIRVIISSLRRLCRIPRGAKTRHVVQYLGISSDEAHRMKPAKDAWTEHRYPLVEHNISRADCIAWMEANGFPRPPRSACVFCPYHSDREWLRLRNEDAAGFERAVQFEREVQRKALRDEVLSGVPFLHSSRVPLDQVTFKDDESNEGWGNECEGMCGI